MYTTEKHSPETLLMQELPINVRTSDAAEPSQPFAALELPRRAWLPLNN